MPPARDAFFKSMTRSRWVQLLELSADSCRNGVSRSQTSTFVASETLLPYTASDINLPGVFLCLDLGRREACLESRHAYDAGD